MMESLTSWRLTNSDAAPPDKDIGPLMSTANRRCTQSMQTVAQWITFQAITCWQISYTRATSNSTGAASRSLNAGNCCINGGG